MASKSNFIRGGTYDATAVSNQGLVSVGMVSGTVRPGILGIGNEILTAIGPAMVDVSTTVSSQASVVSYHPTLFEDFRLSADAVYNFYVADEQVNVSQDPSASLNSLPRYVELSWRSVPFRTVEIPVSRKGLRPLDPRTISVESALDVSVAKTAVANGYISPGVISTLLVPPINPSTRAGFDEDGFLLEPTHAGASAPSVAAANPDMMRAAVPSQMVRTRVQFVDPSVGGALDPNRVAVAADHTHLASLGSLAKLAAGLEVISEFNQDVPPRNPPPKFPITTDAPTLAYVGYVIERYTLDKSGSMVLSRTIDIPDPSTNSFVDRAVTYGGVYSYRIRSLVQWTHPPDVTFAGQSRLDLSPAWDVSAPSPQKVANFYAGEWSDWSRTRVLDTSPPDPPDELTVMPRSRDGSVRIVWKMPADPQRDIAALHLVRATVTPDGTGDWELLLSAVPGNGSYDDRAVAPYEDGHTAYLYAMFSTSFHGEISVLSEQIEARIRRRTSREEWPLRQIRPRGGDPKIHASGFPDAHPAPLVARNRVAFYCRVARSDHPLFSKSYVVEVRSLSTGERVEVDLVVDSTDVKLGSAGPGNRA